MSLQLAKWAESIVKRPIFAGITHDMASSKAKAKSHMSLYHFYGGQIKSQRARASDARMLNSTKSA